MKNCRNLSSTEVATCLRCTDFYLVKDQVCVNLEIKHCEAYELGRCSKCQTGFYMVMVDKMPSCGLSQSDDSLYFINGCTNPETLWSKA